MNKALKIAPFKASRFVFILIGLIGIQISVFGQDTSRSILDINNSKIVKKVNALLDSNQKKINKFIFN